MLPTPYEGIRAYDISGEALERLPQFPMKLNNTNDLLLLAKPLFKNIVWGAESIAIDARDGSLLMLDKFGGMHKASASHEIETSVGYIGPGRPLGYHFMEEGRALVVCDSLKGLLHVDLAMDNRVTMLDNRVTYCNDVDVAADGTIYYSSATAGTVRRNKEGFYDTMHSFMLTMFSGEKSGRLLQWKDDGTIDSLMEGLWFANGVAVHHDQQSVLVVETIGARVLRRWVAGPKVGKTEVFIDKLPAFPDGISRGSDGTYWLCLVAPPSPLLNILRYFGPRARTIIAHILTSDIVQQYKHLFLRKFAMVMRLSSEGEVVDELMDVTGERVFTVSAAEEYNGKLYLGNLEGDFVSVLDLTEVQKTRASR